MDARQQSLDLETKVRDRAQELLFQHHKNHFQDILVPLLYHPKDSRKQNIEVAIPGTDRREELVLNDVVDVSIEAAEAASQTEHWRLGYTLAVHSSQGLTMEDPKRSGSSTIISSGQNLYTSPCLW